MAAAAKTPRRRLAKKKPSERALLFAVRTVKVVDEASGEIVRMKGLFPAYPLDRRWMNERGVNSGDIVMGDLFKDRNPRFWKKFHALGTFLSENVAEMEGVTAHTALKRVQLAAQVHCKMTAIEPDESTAAMLREAGIDRMGFRKLETESLNFDDTDEVLATEVWEAICDYVARTYFPDWDTDQVAEAVSFWERDQ